MFCLHIRKMLLEKKKLCVYFADLSTKEILNLYVTRWNIEVYFRDCKNKLAPDRYQIRSAKGIRRLWLIASLVYLLACLESQTFKFSEGFHVLSSALFREQVAFIFDYAANGGVSLPSYRKLLNSFVHFDEFAL